MNFQTYYYIVLSYAAGESNTRPYLPGRKIKKFSASPHKLEPKFGGSSVPSFYGDGPELQRLSGKGNGMNDLELKSEVIEDILRNNSVANPIYENGMGPVDIKVIDPLKIPLGEFELSLVPKGVTQNAGNNEDSLWADSTAWILTNLTTGESVTSDTSLAYENEQIILRLGYCLHLKFGCHLVHISYELYNLFSYFIRNICSNGVCCLVYS